MVQYADGYHEIFADSDSAGEDFRGFHLGPDSSVNQKLMMTKVEKTTIEMRSKYKDATSLRKILLPVIL